MKTQIPTVTLRDACPALGTLKRHFQFQRATEQRDRAEAVARHKRAMGKLVAPQFGARC